MDAPRRWTHRGVALAATLFLGWAAGTAEAANQPTVCQVRKNADRDVGVCYSSRRLCEAKISPDQRRKLECVQTDRAWCYGSEGGTHCMLNAKACHQAVFRDRGTAAKRCISSRLRAWK
ncbi:MAG: hypothetical protein AAFZ18_18385 [Myxococcota bacterium]